MSEERSTLTQLLETIPNYCVGEITNAIIKAWPKIHGWKDHNDNLQTSYPVIMASISGGSDSDIMLDMLERIGHPKSIIHYVFYDTGIEYRATKNHLSYLESKYGITIERYPANLPVPAGVKKYGLPFLSKQVSQYIDRLQKHNFQWEDDSFENLWKKYPNCKAALRWWCNKWDENSRTNINYHKHLKQFMLTNPPDFKISDGCCNGAKKYTAHKIEKILKPDLVCLGLRKSEGGARSISFNSCFSEQYNKADIFRPIFWFTKNDKILYEQIFSIQHSNCYTCYGLDRTGCAGCPFGKNFEHELQVLEKYEPQLYRAVVNIFHKSYEYTRKYREFCKSNTY